MAGGEMSTMTLGSVVLNGKLEDVCNRNMLTSSLKAWMGWFPRLVSHKIYQTPNKLQLMIFCLLGAVPQVFRLQHQQNFKLITITLLSVSLVNGDRYTNSEILYTERFYLYEFFYSRDPLNGKFKYYFAVHCSMLVTDGRIQSYLEIVALDLQPSKKYYNIPAVEIVTFDLCLRLTQATFLNVYLKYVQLAFQKYACGCLNVADNALFLLLNKALFSGDKNESILKVT
uniref:Uncharacterized protein n=1 Tax=Glossina austeni TaxID=7395 RepID=A0A1A9UPE4_GLOAU